MSKNILIVEDDNSISQLLFDLLEETYPLEQAFSGTEALRILNDQSFDLILLDLMLPGLSGEELIKEIRISSRTPIIVITAKSDIHVLEKVFQLGANDFIEKPFHTIEVKARIAAHLKNTNGKETKHSKDTLSVGELKMDLQARSASLNHQPLELKFKEFELLKCFLTYPDKVFTKANLYETVWKEPYFGDDNTISVHISRLRHQLSKHSDKELIQTVWGVGFKLNVFDID